MILSLIEKLLIKHWNLARVVLNRTLLLLNYNLMLLCSEHYYTRKRKQYLPNLLECKSSIF